MLSHQYCYAMQTEPKQSSQMLVLLSIQAVFRQSDPGLLRWVADGPEEAAVLEFVDCANRLAGALRLTSDNAEQSQVAVCVHHPLF